MLKLHLRVTSMRSVASMARMTFTLPTAQAVRKGLTSGKACAMMGESPQNPQDDGLHL